MFSETPAIMASAFPTFPTEITTTYHETADKKTLWNAFHTQMGSSMYHDVKYVDLND